jgi:hypothetical protein
LVHVVFVNLSCKSVVRTNGSATLFVGLPYWWLCDSFMQVITLSWEAKMVNCAGLIPIYLRNHTRS